MVDEMLMLLRSMSHTSLKSHTQQQREQAMTTYISRGFYLNWNEPEFLAQQHNNHEMKGKSIKSAEPPNSFGFFGWMAWPRRRLLTLALLLSLRLSPTHLHLALDFFETVTSLWRHLHIHYLETVQCWRCLRCHR